MSEERTRGIRKEEREEKKHRKNNRGKGARKKK